MFFFLNVSEGYCLHSTLFILGRYVLFNSYFYLIVVQGVKWVTRSISDWPAKTLHPPVVLFKMRKVRFQETIVDYHILIIVTQVGNGDGS